jgi:hypothetical protein
VSTSERAILWRVVPVKLACCSRQVGPNLPSVVGVSASSGVARREGKRVAIVAALAYPGMLPAVEITTAMNSNQLSKAQAKHMHTALAPALRYLNRLYERLNARSFTPEDRLYRAAFKAQAALSELVMVLHYLTCDGVGEPGRSQ